MRSAHVVINVSHGSLVTAARVIGCTWNLLNQQFFCNGKQSCLLLERLGIFLIELPKSQAVCLFLLSKLCLRHRAMRYPLVLAPLCMWACICSSTSKASNTTTARKICVCVSTVYRALKMSAGFTLIVQGFLLTERFLSRGKPFLLVFHCPSQLYILFVYYMYYAYTVHVVLNIHVACLI